MAFQQNDRGQFADRRDAGRRLAKALTRYGDQHPVVLALPRGGVPVGFQIAQALQAPLDILLVRKLGAPGFPELALGAVVGGAHPQRVLNPHVIESMSVPPDYIEAEARAQYRIIEEREHLYRGQRPPLPVQGRPVVVTDDGIATGATMRVALQALSLAGVKSKVVAVPVAPQQTLELLRTEADEVVCLLAPEDFHSVGFYYADFAQTSDEEVIELLARAKSPD